MIRGLKLLLIIGFTICCCESRLMAQENFDSVIEELLENMDDTENIDTYLEQLTDLYEHPFNINTATKEQLEQIPFLTDAHVENILYHIYKNGYMHSEKELLLIEDLDVSIAHLLSRFVTFEIPVEKTKLKLKQIAKYGKHSLMTRVDIPFYLKEGYKAYTRSELEKNPNKQYIGYQFYHNFRYNFKYSNHIDLGLTAEVDAGEPFFVGRNKNGYDYYSPYLLITDVNKLKTLALGNYRLSYGYGLVMNTDFGMGKTSSLSTIRNRNKGIHKHSSTNEYNYFQGIAISYQPVHRLTTDVFYSYRNMDGTLNDNMFITSLKTDGYHRLPREFEKKNTFINQLIGTNLSYNGRFFDIGLTGVYNFFNKELKPTANYYNKYYPQGKYFYNVGINYRFFYKKLSLYGETALDKNQSLATVNTLIYAPKSSVQYILMGRFYDARYQSLYANTISENSRVQNESAVYAGVETTLIRQFKLSTYIDLFYFPWKRYLVSKLETKGIDGLIQLSYSPTSTISMFVKYQYKNKMKDLTENKEKVTLPFVQQRLRYQLTYQPSDKLSLKTTLHGNRVGYQNHQPSYGFLVSQSGSYKFSKFMAAGTFTWFNTDDYDSRITLYERNVLYAYSLPSFYYKGIRTALNFNYEYNRRITLQLKYGMTHYTDRDAIGTGLEQILSSTRNDLIAQLRIKF